MFSFQDYFQNKQNTIAESKFFQLNGREFMMIIDAERLLRLKGVIESDGKIVFDHRKEEQEHILSIASSYLLDSLNNEQVETMNKYIQEAERVEELRLDAATVNYRDCLLENFR